jgi:DNA uptake protein ComE-like DNA-binding protein
MKTLQKLAYALCFSLGVAVPLAALAQMTPTAPKANELGAPTGGPSSSTMSPMPMGTSSPTSMPGSSMPMSTSSPTPGSMAPDSGKTTEPKSSKSKTSKPVAAKVNVNTATMAELIKVNGIGPATAKKIVTGRPYASLSELVTKKAMQPKQFDSVKSQLTAQ